MLDAVIVGGGPAGLSAALILGRCLRQVVICDNGKQRNAYSHALNGFLTRDGELSAPEFLSKARADLEKYPTVSYKEAEVLSVEKKDKIFEVTLNTGDVLTAKKLLIATGVVDEIPKLNGIGKLWGRSVFNCPYCDAFEVSGKRIAVYGKAERGLKLSLTMKHWSDDIVLVTDGPSDLNDEQRALLKKHAIPINEDKIACLEGEEGQLTAVTFENGKKLPREALFFNTPSFIRSRLLEHLNCQFSESEGVPTGDYERTEIPGLFVAGNILRNVQLVIVAAAEGAQAAFGINNSLIKEEMYS